MSSCSWTWFRASMCEEGERSFSARIRHLPPVALTDSRAAHRLRPIRCRLRAPALALVVALACGGGVAPDDSGDVRVLFVGNSLTEFNDLPEVFRSLAMAGGVPAPAIGSVLRSGYSLSDHWAEGDARRALEGSRWTTVVLQQGPSALPSSQVELIDFTTRFDSVARARGTRTGLYMVWPPLERYTAFDSVAASYRAAAAAVDGILFPAGDAWQAAWRRDPDLALYSSDGFHPTVAGTYLAALVFYATVYDRSPVGLPASLTTRSGVVVNLSPQVALTLQRAAAEVTSADARR